MPGAFSFDPTRPLIWGSRHAFGVRGKLHMVSLWQDIQIDIERNPFQQIFQGCHKGGAFFFVLNMIACKMNISTTTSELSTRIAKPE